MTRWEYRIENWAARGLEGTLAALGDNGWELAGVIPSTADLIFKRPKPDPSELERLGNMASTF